MTAADLATLQRSLRQMLPDLGISSVLTALKKALPELTVQYNAVFQLETRLNAINKDRIRGIISQDDLELAYNRISADLLDLIDALQLTDFDVKTAESSVEDKAGSILYRIPHIMEVEEEHRCIVRLAFDVDSVVKNIELTKDTVVKDVRVSEVMEVELVDPNSSPCFAIRRLNSVEQFLEKNEYTEWIFFVKPLVTGELPLVLKVSVKEIINDRERIKEIVLEEVITVIAEPAPADESTTFQNAGYTISYSNTPDSSQSSDSKRKMAMLLIVGLAVAGGILAAGISLGWISIPPGFPPIQQKRPGFLEKTYQEHTRSSFETYLRAYPNGLFMETARQKIDSLKQLDTSANTPAKTTPPNQTTTPPPLAPSVTTPPAKKPKPTPTKPANPKPTTPPATNTKPPTSPIPVDTIPPTPESSKSTRSRKSGFDMVPVPGGIYNTSAKDCPGTALKIQDFSIGKYEITQADWKEIMGTSPSFHSNCSDCPVEKVSWDEVQRFLKIASQKHGKQYRLPCEIEWEYAAKGGQRSLGKKYAGGNDPNGVAWFNIIQEKTHEVGTKRANELGIYDMSGNVWEWCDEPYPAYLQCTIQPSTKKALRGGSWADKRSDVLVTARRQEKSKNTDRRSGFRVCLSQR